MLEAAGLAKTAKTREDLLRSWKANETTSHWGEGSPATAYRMTEGGADPFGSLSFNQILYKFRYSRKPCTKFKEADLNAFDPKENLKGFTLFSSLKSGGTQPCTGTFHDAYVLKKFTKTHGTDKPLKYYHTVGTLKNVGTKDDEYEIFSKAVAGYNGGRLFLKKGVWAYLLSKTQKPTQAEKNAGTFSNKIDGSCFSCEYSINVKNKKYGLPYRTYIWEGAKGKDLNGDGEIKNVAANPNTVPPTLESKEEGWCFAYGEKEWMDGKLFSKIKQKAADRDADDVPQIPVGRVSCN